jgi:glutathione synthase/RimK-type ligase-like ATP-grasp enzyme
MGTRVIRLNADLPVDIGPWDPASERVLDVGSIWWRQFELPSTAARSNVASFDELLVTRAQWRAWLSALDDGMRPWLNPLWSARRAENKVEQLRTAKRCGFSLPVTTVTNDPNVARTFASAGPSIVKSLAAGYFEFSGDGFVYTHDVEEGLSRTVDEEWREQPVIVQRRIFGEDVRVVAFDNQCFAGRCRTDEVDWRLAGAAAPWRQSQVPRDVQQACDRYLEAFGLRYAAFDFIDDGDTYWFLEANQAGEWSFLDRSLGLGVAESLAKYLIHLAAS